MEEMQQRQLLQQQQMQQQAAAAILSNPARSNRTVLRAGSAAISCDSNEIAAKEQMIRELPHALQQSMLRHWGVFDLFRGQLRPHLHGHPRGPRPHQRKADAKNSISGKNTKRHRSYCGANQHH